MSVVEHEQLLIYMSTSQVDGLSVELSGIPVVGLSVVGWMIPRKYIVCVHFSSQFEDLAFGIWGCELISRKAIDL